MEVMLFSISVHGAILSTSTRFTVHLTSYTLVWSSLEDVLLCRFPSIVY